jgi:hypothetical protein
MKANAAQGRNPGTGTALPVCAHAFHPRAQGPGGEAKASARDLPPPTRRVQLS